MKNKIIDLFCGCGGLSSGFEAAGFHVTLAVDIWADAIDTYNHNHKSKVAICRDLTTISQEELIDLNINNDIVGVIGGPPCQGFSTVGTRDVNDARNQLYLEYYRVVKTIRPEFFVIENVKGLLTLNNGKFKDDILERFQDLGYSVHYDILNAADYGIPQNRKRVFFVGIKNKVFTFPDGKDYKVTTQEALSDLPSLDPPVHKNYVCEPSNEYQKRMRGASTQVHNHAETKHTAQTKEIISMIKDGGTISDLPEEYWDVRKYNKAFQRMPSNGQSNTIDTGHRNYFHYKENRIPSVREAARIQSFNDEFEFLGSKTSQYKQVGNAVPPLLAYEIAKAIYNLLNE